MSQTSKIAKNGNPSCQEKKLKHSPIWLTTVNEESCGGKTSRHTEAQEEIKEQMIKFPDLKELC